MFMKKALSLFLAVVVLAISSCSGAKYCPTYSKEPVQKELKNDLNA